VPYNQTCDPDVGDTGKNPTCSPACTGSDVCTYNQGAGASCVSLPQSNPKENSYNKCYFVTSNSLSCASCVNLTGSQLDYCIACIAGGVGGGVCAEQAKNLFVPEQGGGGSPPADSSSGKCVGDEGCTGYAGCPGIARCVGGVLGACQAYDSTCGH